MEDRNQSPVNSFGAFHRRGSLSAHAIEPLQSYPERSREPPVRLNRLLPRAECLPPQANRWHCSLKKDKPSKSTRPNTHAWRWATPELAHLAAAQTVRAPTQTDCSREQTARRDRRHAVC